MKTDWTPGKSYSVHPTSSGPYAAISACFGKRKIKANLGLLDSIHHHVLVELGLDQTTDVDADTEPVGPGTRRLGRPLYSIGAQSSAVTR